MNRIITALFVLTVGAALAAQQTPSPEALLKAAQQREQVDGDLAGALGLYQRLVEKFPKHAVSAEALSRVAGIQERQGQHAAARETRERIVAEFPDSRAATAARTQLDAAHKDRFTETELTVTGKADDMLGRGRVSPDGRYISFEDQRVVAAGGTGNLAIWDTRSGETRIVNKFSNAKPWADGFAENSTWSPDGRELAYAWHVKGGSDNRELRVVDLRSGRHRIVLRESDSRPRLSPLAYSPDGRHLLVTLGTPAGEGTVRETELAMITLANGAKKTLKTYDGSMPAGAVFSTDGKYIAYDYQPQERVPARDISVMHVGTGRESAVAPDASSHEVLLGWFRDGHLLFTSDRRGETDAWAVRIVDGIAAGAPFVIRRNVGPLEPQGITKNGRVFAQRTVMVREVYIAELDAVTGKALRAPALLSRAQPSVRRREAAWSPDGSHIAYVQSAPGVAESVVVQTIATGDVRVYQVHVRNIDWPLWTPDGRAFVFDGTGQDNVQRTFRLDLQSAAVEPISDRIVIGMTPDGEFLYEVGPGQGLVRKRIADGATESLGQAGGAGSTLSPDGRWVAYIGPGARGQRPLIIRAVSDGAERVVVERFAPGYPRIAWSRDSRFIVFNNNPGGLHRVSIDGGRPESLDVKGMGQITELSMHPDGRRIAFCVSRNERELVVWENVLPKKR